LTIFRYSRSKYIFKGQNLV